MRLTKQVMKRDIRLGTMKGVETRISIGESKDTAVGAPHFNVTKSLASRPTVLNHHKLRNPPASKPTPRRHPRPPRTMQAPSTNHHQSFSRLRHQTNPNSSPPHRLRQRSSPTKK